MIDFALSLCDWAYDNLDAIFLVAAIVIAWIAQTKASAITAIEFIVSILSMALIYSLEINTPWMWLYFALVSFCATLFHIICTSNPAIFTSFGLAMIYNLCMFYDWGLMFWSGHQPGFFEKSHSVIMPVLVSLQLFATLFYGGFKDGLNRWYRNFSDRRNPYLCALPDGKGV